ncbi:MAG TPA: MFS transporter [Ktedonobacteraceae bacterium]|nr:MFS transporter [Ktedonobacteraceae bacterium]
MKRIAYAPGDERIVATWRKILICILITLVGINLRSIILGVPPILPLISHALSLSYTETGLLTAVPTLVLGLTAWPAGMLSDRIGPRSCVTLGLLLLAAGAILRAAWANPLALFLFTIMLSVGIALSQTAVPILARRWFPSSIGLVSALFSDGLIIGETIAAGLTVPIMLAFLGKDAWAASFVFWGAPIVVLLVLWLLLTPQTAPTSPQSGRDRDAANTEPTAAMTVAATPIETPMPVPVETGKVAKGKKPGVNAWHLGIMIGANSLIYFNLNGWIAPYNQALHHSSLTPLALAVLNAAQLPASLAVTVVAQRLAGRRWPFISAGIICAISIAFLVFGPPMLEALWAGLCGASTATVFTLGIALPPLLAEPDQVARLTGQTVSLTYIIAFIGPYLGGQLWDLFHLPPLAFFPVAIAALVMIALGSMLPSRASFGLQAVPSTKGGHDVA